MTCGVYKIENKINHKVYIGRSNDISRRFQEHQRDYKKKKKVLYSAMRKYGLDNFDFQLLEQCSYEESFEKEKMYIQDYDAYLNGYNATLGGEDGCPSSLLHIIKDIIKDLQQDDMTMVQIGAKYGIASTTVSMINQGKRCFQNDVAYPVREIATTRNVKKMCEKYPNARISKVNGKFVVKYYCVDCGCEIHKAGATRCVKCKSVSERKCVRPDKKTLITAVQNANFSKVGEQYGVSDNTIRKWLKGYHLPNKASSFYKQYPKLY